MTDIILPKQKKTWTRKSLEYAGQCFTRLAIIQYKHFIYKTLSVSKKLLLTLKIHINI